MFREDAEWINVYDPTDPVGASLAAFSATVDGQAAPKAIFPPRNFGYRASPVVLLSHIKYLRSDLADSTVAWILSGARFQPSGARRRWLHSEWLRRVWTAGQWLLVVVALVWAAAGLLPYWIAGLN